MSVHFNRVNNVLVLISFFFRIEKLLKNQPNNTSKF